MVFTSFISTPPPPIQKFVSGEGRRVDSRVAGRSEDAS